MIPVVRNGTVFVGSGDHYFYALDAATGAKRWSYLAGPGFASLNFMSIPRVPALLDADTVYFVTAEGLHALDTTTGSRRWMFPTLEEIPIQRMNMRRKRTPSEPVARDGTIFLTAWPYALNPDDRKGFLYAVDGATGKARWVVTVDGLFITGPTVVDSTVLFAIEERTSTGAALRVTLFAVDALDGRIKWKTAVEGERQPRPILAAGTLVLLPAEKSVTAVDAETGRLAWTYRGEEIVGPLAQHLYVRAKDALRALDLKTGAEKWSQKPNGEPRLVQDGVIYLEGPRVRAIDAGSGKELWSFKSARPDSVGLIAGGRVFLTSSTATYVGSSRVDRGSFHSIDAKTGNLKP
jgi:outer membrane protein assembly factor BamB